MSFTGGLSRPQIVGLTSAVLVAIGTVVPLLTAGVESGTLPGDAARGSIGALGLLTLLFAIVALGLVLLGGLESREPIGITGYGLVIAGLGLWQLLVLGRADAPGIGLSLTLVGGAGLLAAGVWGYQVELREPARQTLEHQ